MASRSEKMYRDSPAMERDEESGKVGIKKPAKKEAESSLGDGEPINVHQASERREMAHRHSSERLTMHHRHEMEHGMHKGDAAEMHGRHEAELAEMHGRHEKDMKAMHKRHGKGEKVTEAGQEKTHGEKDAAKPEKAGTEKKAA